MTINLPLMMDDHAATALRELDDAIARATANVTKLHIDRMNLVAHMQLHAALNPAHHPAPLTTPVAQAIHSVEGAADAV